MPNLDGELGKDIDGTPIRGRETVRVVCAECDSTIAKALRTPDSLWLVAIRKHGINPAASRGAGWIKAPVTVTTSLLQGPASLPRTAWCRKHGNREISLPAVYAADAAGRDKGRPARLPV